MELEEVWCSALTTPLKQASTNEKPGEALRVRGGPGVTREKIAHVFTGLYQGSGLGNNLLASYVAFHRADRGACIGASCVWNAS